MSLKSLFILFFSICFLSHTALAKDNPWIPVDKNYAELIAEGWEEISYSNMDANAGILLRKGDQRILCGILIGGRNFMATEPTTVQANCARLTP